MEWKKYLVRPIQQNDFHAICRIATQVGPGFTSLPNDSNIIEAKIKRSLDSFALKNIPEARLFFFVLEDLSSQAVVGTAAIEVQLSYLSPHYCFKLIQIMQQCSSLNIHKKHRILTLLKNHHDASLFCTLYVHADHRGQGQGEFLSRARCLFISSFPNLFSETIVAIMRGIFDEKDYSPFWEGLGRHFFDMDFDMANHLIATQGSQFIADLVPTNPIYVTLLPPTAQAVIGKAHEKTRPALRVLEKEGFTFRDNVDIFEAGPILEISRKDLKTVKESQEVTLAGFKDNISNPLMHMISTTTLDFRATLAPIEINAAQEAYLDKKTIEALKLNRGDKIRFCTFR